MSERTIKTTCSYCSVGCNLNITISDDGKTTVRPVPEYPVNQGKVCPKGFHLLTPFRSEERGTTPLRRNAAGEFEKISWHDAFQTFSEGFKAVIDKHGREAAAYYFHRPDTYRRDGSARCPR